MDGSQMTMQRMTEYLRAKGTSSERLRGAFTRMLQLTRILVREQGLDLHDVPQFFHLDFKVRFGNCQVRPSNQLLLRLSFPPFPM